jgi:Terminase large subunit, T4likevirus-type, N-terminal
LWEDFVAKIQIRSGGEMRPFSPYGYQVLLSNLIEKHNNIIVVKSRQLGTTQLVISKFLHRAALNPAYCGMGFFKRQSDADAIARRVNLLASGAKLEIAKQNIGLLQLRNGAEIYFHNSSKEGARSYDSVLDLLFDEAAFCPNIGEIYGASSASSALTEDKVRKIIVSTPSAKSGWYWDKLSEGNDDDIEAICRAVAAGELYSEMPGFYWFVDKNGDCKVVIHWRCHPIYGVREDYLNYRKKQDGTEWEVVLREYDLRFLDPAIEVFSAELVLDCEVDFKPPSGRKICSIGLYLSDRYMTAVAIEDGFVVDCISENSPNPNSAIAAVDRLKSKFLVSQIAIKKADGGEELARRLRQRFGDSRVFEIPNSDFANVVARLQIAIEESAIRFPKYRNLKDPPISKQLRDFRRQGSKFSAPEGKRDDCVWALGFALEVHEARGNVLPFATTG